METRSQRREREAEEALRRNPNYRRWVDLPDLILSSIADRLLSIPDISSFSAVCRSFRLIGKASILHIPYTSRPPFLLRFLTPHRFRRPGHCHLQNPVPTGTRRFLLKLPPETLDSYCIGYSYGCLMFSSDATPTLVDVTTGETLQASPYHVTELCTAVLTAPPSSPSSWMVMMGFYKTTFWRMSTNECFVEDRLRFPCHMRSMAVLNSQIFCLGRYFRLHLIDLHPTIGWRELLVPPPERPGHIGYISRRLVECDGELLVVVISRIERKIHLYRLDLSLMRWVEKESLGDWCIFMDAVGLRPVACPGPGRWGGRRNAIYFAGPGQITWTVIPLDASEINIDDRQMNCDYCVPLYRWPSPVWVCPISLRYDFIMQNSLAAEGLPQDHGDKEVRGRIHWFRYRKVKPQVPKDK